MDVPVILDRPPKRTKYVLLPFASCAVGNGLNWGLVEGGNYKLARWIRRVIRRGTIFL